MKIMLLDPSGWHYDTTTPFKTPLGGTQSAVAYLSGQLADIGNEVTVINGTPEPTLVDGVRFDRLPCATSFMNEHDALVVVGTAFGESIRATGYNRPMILWCHHACDQGAVIALQNEGERAAYQGYAMVSQWQAETYINRFSLDPGKIKVLRNAASPPFHRTTPGKTWLERGDGPVMAYASTPYRGLDVLLQAFPTVRAKFPGARLRVFSGMGIYNSALDDGFSCLYNLCRELPGVEYIGPVSQSRLAEEMATVDILSYPSTYAETSCIAVMEAMVSGALVVSSSLGALPETTAGFAHLASLEGLDQHRSLFASHYAADLIGVLERCAANPEGTQATIDAQLAFARDSYTWHNRAVEWQGWLETLSV